MAEEKVAYQKKEQNNTLHNTLYQTDEAFLDARGFKLTGRPPP
jgi:hypothetical protein